MNDDKKLIEFLNKYKNIIHYFDEKNDPYAYTKLVIDENTSVQEQLKITPPFLVRRTKFSNYLHISIYYKTRENDFIRIYYDDIKTEDRKIKIKKVLK